jgi:lipid-A-disaccharide synthase
MPGASFFGCAGPELRAAGVEAVVEAESLSVVGLVEVLAHIPRIYGEFRRIAAAARERRPAAALLVDSPDFHLRLAGKLDRLGIPVFYLVAPQAWAWREGRVRTLRRHVRQLHCIFPFEEPFFRDRGVDARYIGHPLARQVRPSMGPAEFFRKHGLDRDRPLVTLCPGSRRGESARHLPVLAEAVRAIAARSAAQFVWAAPAGATARFGPSWLAPLAGTGLVKIVEGETWDALAHATVALAASGTVTTEAALAGTPVVTYYQVSRVTWILGKPLVRVPFLSMVNLVAGRRVIEELIQGDMTADRLSAAALRLLEDSEARAGLREELLEFRSLLATAHDPLNESARLIHASILEKA